MDKPKIILADDIEDVREILVMLIESEFELDILEAESGNQAIEILKDNPQVAMVMSDYNMPDGNGGVFYEYVKENSKVPFILLTSEELADLNEFKGFQEQNPLNGYLAKPCSHKILTDAIGKVLHEVYSANKDIKEAAIEQTGKFIRINIDRIKKYKKAFSDIHVRLSDDKFIRVISAGDDIGRERLENYQKKNVDYVHVSKDDFIAFINKSLEEAAEKLSNENLLGDELVTLQLTTIEQIHDVVLALGVPKHVLEVTDKIAGSVTRSLEKDKSLNKYLGDILNKENYIFEQSNIINYLCAGMNQALGWDKNRTVPKFINASMFCDMAITDPKLAAYLDLDSEEFKKLEPGEQKIIKGHIDSSVKVISGSKNISDEVLKIVQQHHEKPDGVGFPRKLNHSNIPPMSAAFILAHDFARLLILGGKRENYDPQEILNKLGDQYSLGNFGKIFEALKKALSIE